MKFILLLVYIWSGELNVLRQSFDTQAQCTAAAEVIVKKQVEDPHFDEGIFGACIQALETNA